MPRSFLSVHEISEKSMPLDLSGLTDFTPLEDLEESVLVVDDEAGTRNFVKNALQSVGDLNVLDAENVCDAREILSGRSVDLILADVVMPDESGIDLLRWCRDEKIDTPFLVMTGYTNLDCVVDAINLNVHSFLQKPFSVEQLMETVTSALAKGRYERTQREFQEHLSRTNNILRQRVIDAVVEQEALFLGGLSALAQIIDARDPYTQQHSASVAALARRVAHEMRLSMDEQHALETAGALHDIGKIAVPESILLKPGKLTGPEYDVMKDHPMRAVKILCPMPGLEESLRGIRGHHERFDGKGYPDGVGGKEIPLQARILSVCDTWDAMTSDRPYRKAMSTEMAASVLREVRGTQLCPEVVETFLGLVDKGVVDAIKQ
jgi:putative two-component system response regulator